jgi:hypothetical protein
MHTHKDVPVVQMFACDVLGVLAADNAEFQTAIVASGVRCFLTFCCLPRHSALLI